MATVLDPSPFIAAQKQSNPFYNPLGPVDVPGGIRSVINEAKDNKQRKFENEIAQQTVDVKAQEAESNALYREAMARYYDAQSAGEKPLTQVALRQKVVAQLQEMGEINETEGLRMLAEPGYYPSRFVIPDEVLPIVSNALDIPAHKLIGYKPKVQQQLMEKAITKLLGDKSQEIEDMRSFANRIRQFNIEQEYKQFSPEAMRSLRNTVTKQLGDDMEAFKWHDEKPTDARVNKFINQYGYDPLLGNDVNTLLRMIENDAGHTLGNDDLIALEKALSTKAFFIQARTEFPTLTWDNVVANSDFTSNGLDEVLLKSYFDAYQIGGVPNKARKDLPFLKKAMAVGLDKIAYPLAQIFGLQEGLKGIDPRVE